MGEDALKVAGVLALGVAIAACAPAPAPDVNRVWSVEEVIRDIHVLNGKSVRIAGYLAECGGLECGLYRNHQDRQVVEQEEGSDWPDWLSISFVPRFDAKAAAYQNSYVVVTARVSNQCRVRRVKCTDRAPDLTPSEIVAQ